MEPASAEVEPKAAGSDASADADGASTARLDELATDLLFLPTAALTGVDARVWETELERLLPRRPE